MKHLGALITLRMMETLITLRMMGALIIHAEMK